VTTYIVKFSGLSRLEADSAAEALEDFWANILEIFEETDISDVSVQEAK
jgi:hypothetical protein